MVQITENIMQNEVDLIKIILNKIILDEQYKSLFLRKNFLYFSKIALFNPKLKGILISNIRLYP